MSANDAVDTGDVAAAAAADDDDGDESCECTSCWFCGALSIPIQSVFFVTSGFDCMQGTVVCFLVLFLRASTWQLKVSHARSVLVDAEVATELSRR